MKKNISINISGIIFHIEEDGYEILRKYLDSINRYFSSFEDSSEILADIESRIAEILLSKLSEGKQIVTAEDINTLMSTMGSVSDFKAAEEQDFAASEPRQEEKKQSSATGSNIANKKLYRDEKRKILGGVCAGLAHYFNIDPVWPRVLIALLVFASYGGLVLLYIILWIVIPASTTLEDEETSVKKMFRDTEKKVIGGVASGVAAFFGVDVTFIRVAFIALTFVAGLGVVVYIIMWIALPEAKTITEKIQMQGEPVTLSSIESSVKRGLNEKDGKEESALTKIVLFPFRLIAAVIDGLAKILGPVFLLLIDVLRIAIGVMITLTGVTMILSLIFIFGFAFGFFNIPDGSILNDWYLSAPDFPHVLRQSLPSWSIFFAFIIAFAPALMIALLGSSIIARKIVFSSYVGWTLFVIFFVSVAFLSFTVPQLVYSFKEEGEYKIEKTFPVIGKAPMFRINETGMDDFDMTDLTLKGYDGKELRVVERFQAQGSTRKVAAENAQMVEYQIIQSDSVLTFDSDFTFKKDAKFRAQRLDIDLYVPYNQPFIIDESMWRLIDNRYDDYNYYSDRDENQTWKVSEYGLLECITCHNKGPKTVDRMVTRDEFGLANFNSIDLQGVFDVRIQQGDQYAVEMKGPENERRRYQIYVDGETLVIDYDDDRDYFWKRDLIDDHEIELTITMPSVHELDAKGAGKIRLRGFSEEEMQIRLLGAVMADVQMDARNLTVDLTGASFLDLSGSGGFLDADITGASGLRAYSYEVKHAIVEAHGASSAKVFVTEKLEMETGLASSISHRGNPEIIREN